MAKAKKSVAVVDSERPWAALGKELKEYLTRHRLSVERAAELGGEPVKLVPKMMLGELPSEQFLLRIKAALGGSAPAAYRTEHAPATAEPKAAGPEQPVQGAPAAEAKRGKAAAMREAYGRRMAKARAADTDWLRWLDVDELRVLGERCAAEIPARRLLELDAIDAELARLQARRASLAGEGGEA